MTDLLRKEFRLAASPLSYFFVISAFLTFVPGYPILLGAFFTTLGIFYSFQTSRENKDIDFSLLLPVSKADIVKGKFAFCLIIELVSFVIMTAATVVRMTLLKGAPAYTSNALMCANLTFLGFALLIFGLFNSVFIGGFFRTAYYFGKPFILYCIVSLVVIGIAETLHHLPGLAAFNSFGFEKLTLQLPALIIGLIAFSVLTALSVNESVKHFESADM